MDRFSIQNLLNISTLESELELEKATSLFLQFRVFEKKDESYKPLRNHLRKLIKAYEDKQWASEASITDDQIRESDLAEALVQAENEFIHRRKKLIRNKLKETGLNQTDLAKILGHRKGYTSELINGLRPISKEDMVVMNRLLKIKFEDLIPAFIKKERASHIKNTLESIKNNRIKLTSKDFDLLMA